MARCGRSSLARMLLGISLATALTFPVGIAQQTVNSAHADTPIVTRPNLTRPTPPPPPPTPVPVPGQDLVQIDTETAQFVQGTNSQVNVHVYNAPAGISTTTNWQKLDPSLTKRLPDGSFAPANLPFGLRVAPTAAPPYIASLTNEGGVTLRMGLAPLGGPMLSAVLGQQQGSSILFPAPDPATTRDVAVDATTSGFNVRVVLHNAGENPSVTLRVALDSSAYLQQEPSGTIQATRPITSYGDSGPTPNVTLGPEFVIGRATAVDASPGVADLESASSVSLVLGSSSAGAQDVSVPVDSAWLRAAGRTFPVTITIPVVTAFAALHTGVATTVNSCAPTNPSTATDMVVGVVGACANQGKLYFALPHVPGESTVVSATLSLSTPELSTATGVQVYMNGPLPSPYVAPSALDQSASPTLPAVATGASGIPEQSTTNSLLHTWDVTSIVRQWFQDGHTNGGLTLSGSDIPVQFSSPIGSAALDPALDPVLSITYAPTGSVSPAYSDGSPNIYGLSGTFSSCNSPTYQCATYGPISAYGDFNLVGPLGYARIEAQLTCSATVMPIASGDDPQDINTMLTAIYLNLLDPVVVITPNPNCLSTATPSFWQQAVNHFVTNMSYPKNGSQIYFEIGNEPNLFKYPLGAGTSNYQGYGGSALSYENIFAAAAQGIQSAMGSSTSYRILTGGMSSPTGAVHCTTVGGDVNYNDAMNAILAAELAGISATTLGMAVHPYGYRTMSDNQWRNYRGVWPHSNYVDVCTDLAAMLTLWTSFSSLMPVFITEDNWSSEPLMGVNLTCTNTTACEGTYLADLFTYLNDQGYDHTSTSQLRLAWFTGFDFPTYPLGVRNIVAAEKRFNLTVCPSYPSIQVNNIPIWSVFFTLDYNSYSCY